MATEHISHDEAQAAVWFDKGKGVLYIGDDDEGIWIHGTPDELLTFARRVHNAIADRIATWEG